MNTLRIESTEISPKIVYDANKYHFEIIGESRPENVREFYDPVIEWMDNFINEINIEKELNFDFKLEYFNSSSAKYILDILYKLTEYNAKGLIITINWYYEDGDDDMLEAGQEMSRMVSFKFNYVIILD
ncbi:MAG: hypothetical protein A2X12_01845 [Bacteroidetes bacterium GWE2_29_8]|nr:MAG: hypothetical protein A2X12_01845 [Bacteroidetes bacterium GWE2_29_8]OFY23968.1 MAG: hypothetical protein A2X02_00965 [Bacteroidetes bacterium GWF2_29_10]